MNALATVPRETTADDSTLVLQIPVDQVDVGENVRVDVEGIDELAASIKEHGLKQPIKVRPDGGRWLVVYGQRRLLAHRLAGIERIPAIVATESYTPGSLAIEQLIENLHRVDLPPLNRARAMRAVVDAGTSQADLARELGLHPSTVANDLSLLEAPEAIRNSIEKGELSPAHAKALKGLAPKSQLEMAKEAIDRGWSAHETERRVQAEREDAERRRSREAENKNAEAARQAKLIEELVALAKKESLDTPIRVGGYSYSDVGKSAIKIAVLAAGAQGFSDVSEARASNRVKGYCTCKAWQIDVDYYGSYKLRTACIVDAHGQAKATDERKAFDAKRKLESRVRAKLAEVLVDEVAALPQLAARITLWKIFGWSIEEWAKKRDPERTGKKRNPWATIAALDIGELRALLAERLAADLHDGSFNVDWEGLAAELGLTEGASRVTPEAPPKKKSPNQARQDRINAEFTVGAADPTPPEDTRLQPAFGDPVVDVEQGTKYRVSRVGPHALQLAAAAPTWRNGAIVRLADPSRLEYDKEAGLWRGPTVPVEPGDEGAPA